MLWWTGPFWVEYKSTYISYKMRAINRHCKARSCIWPQPCSPDFDLSMLDPFEICYEARSQVSDLLEPLIMIMIMVNFTWLRLLFQLLVLSYILGMRIHYSQQTHPKDSGWPEYAAGESCIPHEVLTRNTCTRRSWHWTTPVHHGVGKWDNGWSTGAALTNKSNNLLPALIFWKAALARQWGQSCWE